MRINLRLLSLLRRVKRDLLTLWFACRHPRTPLIAKVLAVIVAGYAFSPIDLIPDFIPLVGYLDEFVLLPAALFVIFKLIPQPVLDECYVKADTWFAAHRPRPRSWIAATVIIAIWIGVLWLLWHYFGGQFMDWFRGAAK